MKLPKLLRQSINKTAHAAALHNETIIKDRLLYVAAQSIEAGLALDEIEARLKEEADRLALL